MPTQSNRIVAAIRAVLPNAAWDLIKNIGQFAYQNWAVVVVIMGFIASGLTALINRLRGIPSDAVGLLVLFGIVVLVALFSYVIGKVKDRKRAMENRDSQDVADQPLTSHDANTSTETNGGMRICSYELVHRIADHQAKVIRDFVSVSRVAVWEHKLKDSVPTIKWGFMIKNDSIFPISLFEVRNNLFFEDTELAERRFESTNEVQQLPQWREGSVVFEQRLSGPEAQHIRSMPDGKFHFTNLVIKVGNPDSFPVVEPQALEIGNDLVTTLGRITYKETEGMKKLKDEITRLKHQVEEREARVQKPGLRFEIDSQATQVKTSGGGAVSRRVEIDVQLRCTKIGDSKLAIREFSAALFSMDEKGEVEIARNGSQVAYSYPDMKLVETRDGWTIEEPLTPYRWYMFFLDVESKILSQLTPRNSFFRVTMNAIGQEPQHIDFFVDSWSDVISSNSSINLRGAD